MKVTHCGQRGTSISTEFLRQNGSLSLNYSAGYFCLPTTKGLITVCSGGGHGPQVVVLKGHIVCFISLLDQIIFASFTVLSELKQRGSTGWGCGRGYGSGSQRVAFQTGRRAVSLIGSCSIYSTRAGRLRSSLLSADLNSWRKPMGKPMWTWGLKASTKLSTNFGSPSGRKSRGCEGWLTVKSSLIHTLTQSFLFRPTMWSVTAQFSPYADLIWLKPIAACRSIDRPSYCERNLDSPSFYLTCSEMTVTGHTELHSPPTLLLRTAFISATFLRLRSIRSQYLASSFFSSSSNSKQCTVLSMTSPVSRFLRILVWPTCLTVQYSATSSAVVPIDYRTIRLFNRGSMGNLSETCCSKQSKPTEESNAAPKVLGKQPAQTLQLKDFIQLKDIGHGGFGSVYLVKMKNTEKRYAMKVMKKEELKKANLLNNVLLERNILLQAKNNFIVRLRYSFQNSACLYMVMDYIEGGDLYFYLRHEKRFEENVARLIFAETLLAIQFLHTQNIIYRDLKPENILVCPDGHIKLTDFGLSKQVKLNENTKTFAGTPQYLAPQVVKNHSYGPQVDLWELGIFLYQMIRGRCPFSDPTGRNQERTYSLILEGKIQFVGVFSQDAKDLIRKLLRTDPKQRLGARSFQDIKNHPFLDEIDWNALNTKEVASPLLPIVNKYTEVRKRQGNLRNEEASVPAPDNPINLAGFDYLDPNSQTLIERKKL